ncbi:hypothetical protein [Gaetbulibacter saemankumensis]|uniref:hypothetical protein n=1 Tax=Gaetbulibacter saemankumensis TaxID=311208 RepID=UPI000411EE7E|nr:hypothetical protein [Gaetbulibacter saemankumensis]
MKILLLILTVYGISAIITLGKIFEPLRDMAEKHSPNFWKHLTSCMQCLPFWVGIFISLTMGSPIYVTNTILPEYINLFLSYLYAGAFFSGTTMLIHTVFVRLKGSEWTKLQESERNRKIKKGILRDSIK